MNFSILKEYDGTKKVFNKEAKGCARQEPNVRSVCEEKPSGVVVREGL